MGEGIKENMKKIVLLAFVLMLLSLATVEMFARPVAAILPVHNINTGLNYATIQEAIDADETKNGHTILVDAGIYYEHVVVNKAVSLIGENKSSTIIDGIGTGTVIKVTANNANISGFTMRQGHFGIAVYGLGNKISDNIIANNFIGIMLENSSNNVLTGNNASNNHDGIWLLRSSNNIFTGNNASNNLRNFGVEGSDSSDFNNYVDVTNTVDGKPIYYLVDEANTVITGQIKAGTFYLINCKRISIKHLNLTNNLNGIFLWNTTNSKIENVNVSNNTCGISLYGDSSNNTISGNTAQNNTYGIYSADSNFNVFTGNNVSNNIEGIHLDYSNNNNITCNTVANNSRIGLYLKGSNNTIFHNNFINNTQQVYDYYWDQPSVLPSTNFWDDGYPSGGNYWSNYNGTDSDGDGIGDTPYIINELNKDNYPLMSPWSPPPPPFWTQWWFQTIVAVAIVALAGAVYFLKKKRKPPTPTAPTLPTEGTLQNIHPARASNRL